MKKFLSAILVLLMLLTSSIMSFAATGGSGAYDPVTLDEIQNGTVIAFDSEEDYFDTTTYYVKILGEDGEEYIYALANRVNLSDEYYEAEEIAQMDLGEITFVLRNGKVKYINPVMPDGLFESVEVKYCYLKGDTIYTVVEFENIVGEFKLVMAAYDEDNVLCSVKSFDISYMDSYYELDITANGGNVVKLFFWEDVSGLQPLCEVKVRYIPTEYGYLLSVSKTDGEYEFEMFTDGGEVVTFDCAAEIAIDEEVFVEGDNSVANRLEFSSESANNAYEDEMNVTFHQPVMYVVNENGEITHIDTVVSSVNEKISKIVNDKAGYAAYGYKQYTNAQKSFGDFTVDEDTLVFFAPDDRSHTDGYTVYKSYLDAFINSMSYHVEAYGLSEDKVASVVIIYKEVVDKDKIYTYSSPMMIVTNKVLQTNGEVYLKGYSGTSYSLKRVDVDEDEIGPLEALGKGDVIRYITNSSNEMIDYQVWYDADNAAQKEGCDDIDSAIAKRILEINATSIVPVINYPRATFRLQYGTVCGITLSDDGDSICVTPTIANDSIDMATEGNGVVEWEIDSSVKVFEYDGENVLTEADLTDIIPDKTEVIAYSSQGKLRMLYIVKQPYISEKKIMTVSKVEEKVEGYEITGYSEGEEVVFPIDVNKEPVIDDIVKGNVIAYMPEGDTITDIELVFSATKNEFLPEEGESLIAEDTLETVEFGLVEYGTEEISVNGVSYTTTDNTNYLLMKYGNGTIYYGIGKRVEMKNEYVLIRVKADKPTEIADVVIFQEMN